MSTLRWILLVLGVTVIAVIYFIGRRKDQNTLVRREPALGFRWTERNEPQLSVTDDIEHDLVQAESHDTELINFDDLIARGLESEVADFRQQTKPKPTSSSKASTSQTDTNSMLLDSELVVLNLFASTHTGFDGAELYLVFEQAGFEWSDDQLFHCYAEHGEYLALNALKPGTFPEQPDDFNTQAVGLILQLPKVDAPLLAYDEFLQLAKQLQTKLNARLCDMQRSSLTKQTIAYLRDEVQQYQFKHRK